jgi:hypothetical protein
MKSIVGARCEKCGSSEIDLYIRVWVKCRDGKYEIDEESLRGTKAQTVTYDGMSCGHISCLEIK